MNGLENIYLSLPAGGANVREHIEQRGLALDEEVVMTVVLAAVVLAAGLGRVLTETWRRGDEG